MKEGGQANVCNISGLGSDWNIHCDPCKFALSDIRGEKAKGNIRKVLLLCGRKCVMKKKICTRKERCYYGKVSKFICETRA